MSTFSDAYDARRFSRQAKEDRAVFKRRHAKVNRTKRYGILARIKTSRGCDRCGVHDLPSAAYDFHHRDPNTKDFTIAQGMCFAWDRLKAEIAKCDVLCANCHRTVEAEVRQVSL